MRQSENVAFKPWKVGDPFQYPIKTHGDHWETLIEPVMERDSAQCAAWKEEIQNLLIFAGLFSGVLSAFVVQSYQTLQPDAVTALLSQIVQSLDNSSSNALDSSQSDSVIPLSLIRVNILWFISLVLSLTTVLIGIVCMQWIGEHLNYPSSLSPMDKLSLFNMRHQSMKTWCVPQIVSSVPLILQAALVLFLVGLVDFILGFGSPVLAIPVIIVTGIPLLFIVFTTTVPTYQAITMKDPEIFESKDVPAQCPYKSTQSRAFFRLTYILWSSFMLLATYLRYSVKEMAHLPGVSESYNCLLWDPSLFLFGRWRLNGDSWLSFDFDWLSLRTGYARIIGNPTWNFPEQDLLSLGPVYDTIQGFHDFLLANERFDTEKSGDPLYSCFSDINNRFVAELSLSTDGHYGPIFDYRRQNAQLLRNILASSGKLEGSDPDANSLSSMILSTPIELLLEENLLLLLSRKQCLPKGMVRHFMELHIRVTNYLYNLDAASIELLNQGPTAWFSYAMNVFGYYPGRPTDDPEFEEISTQFSHTIKSYYELISNQDIKEAWIIYSPYVKEINHISPNFLNLQSHDEVESIADFLASRLIAHMEADPEDNGLGARSDLIYYAAAYYAQHIADHQPTLLPKSQNLNHALKVYASQRRTPNIGIRRRLGILWGTELSFLVKQASTSSEG